MNNKGFTLIEIIMTIAILAMITLLSTPNIIKLINKNKADNYNSTIDSIIKSTEIYASDNRYKLTFEDNTGNSSFCSPTDTKDIYSYITLQDLVNSKNISEEIKNPCTDKIVSTDEISIKIILNCKTRQFNYELYDNGDNFKGDINNKIFKIEEGKTCNDL